MLASLGITEQAVARGQPYAGLPIRLHGRAFSREFVDSGIICLRGICQDFAEVGQVVFGKAVKAVGVGEDEAAAEGHFQIELGGVAGGDHKLRGLGFQLVGEYTEQLVILLCLRV